MVFKLLTKAQHKHYSHRQGIHITDITDINFQIDDAIAVADRDGFAITYVVYRSTKQLKQLINYIVCTHKLEII